jgi:hypothetical protein
MKLIKGRMGWEGKGKKIEVGREVERERRERPRKRERQRDREVRKMSSCGEVAEYIDQGKT